LREFASVVRRLSIGSKPTRCELGVPRHPAEDVLHRKHPIAGGAGVAASSCGSDERVAPRREWDAGVPRDLRVLVFSRTAGFRHPSIENAKAFFEALDLEMGPDGALYVLE
jgi:hypothetical protein